MMKKESTIVFTVICVYILLGSPSCMVFGNIQECQTARDCDPASCDGIMVCPDGICVCEKGTRRKDSCKKDSDCKTKCPPKCIANCLSGICFCTECESQN
ncbi:uncharacterized protein LOC132066594 [Lycium ferocissimum]|uniref:uncharacterized protein LOC132066594 n=1 Tax=Lycium ferocissimum TaxID=112874 RepID=UPI0028166FBE|nr:uncharacterized protein LOC132066594 [Lycium ferocissimum]